MDRSVSRNLEDSFRNSVLFPSLILLLAVLYAFAMTRTERSINSFASSLLLQLITMGMGVVSTPLLLSWLGDERFGAFRSATDWMGQLKILELGLGGSLLPMLAIALGRGDRTSILLTLTVGIRAYFRVALVILGGALVLGYFILKLVPIQASLSHELQLGYWIGLLGLLWLPLTPFRLLSDASQRSDLVNLIFIAQSILITGLSLSLAHTGIGIPGQFIAVFIGTVSANLLLSWRELRQYPDVILQVFRASPATRPIQQQLKQLSLPTLLFTLSGQISLLTDNLLIAYFLGPASVVPFVMTQRLTGLAQGQMQSVGNATWAALADLHAKAEHARFNTKLIDLSRLVTLLGLTMAIPIAIYNPNFIQLWVGTERFAGWQVNFLAACNAVLLGVISLWGWCFSGTGNIAKLVPIAVSGAGVNIAISLIATPTFKMMGPLLGTFIAFMTVYLWGVPVQMQQVFGTSRKALWTAIARPFCLAIFYTPSMLWIAQVYPPKGWIHLGISMLVTALLFIAIAWFTVLAPNEREQWNWQLKKLIRLKEA